MGLVSLALYLATLAPGLTWAHDSADGGELAVAAHSLGIAHPPGYPTYVLLAHPIAALPIGELATRTNLFSALCAAGTSAVLAWTVARSGGGWLGGGVAGLALAVAPVVWSQAVVTEVHTLNAFFLALLLALAVVASRDADPGACTNRRLGFATGLAWGLALGNHPTAALFAPLVCAGARGRARRWRYALAGLALGLGVYLLLPVRAAANPAANWGDPRTVGRFWRVVSGRPYQGFVFGLPVSRIPERSLAWVQTLVLQFGAPGLLAAALGAATLWTTRRGLLAATAATSMLCSAFAVGYNTSDSYLYLIPAIVCMGFWVGAGVNWLVGVAQTQARVLAWIGIAVALALLSAATALRFPVQDLSDDREPDEFRAAVLDRAPSEAIILTQRDRHTFALWYYQHSSGARHDVTVVDLDLLGLGWYNESMARRMGAGFETDGLGSAGEAGLLTLADGLGRPVCRVREDARGLACLGP